jgi:hypothetical protein
LREDLTIKFDTQSFEWYNNISRTGVRKIINALFLIPAFIMGYVVCYVAMTYKVDQWEVFFVDLKDMN